MANKYTYQLKLLSALRSERESWEKMVSLSDSDLELRAYANSKIDDLSAEIGAIVRKD